MALVILSLRSIRLGFRHRLTSDTADINHPTRLTIGLLTYAIANPHVSGSSGITNFNDADKIMSQFGVCVSLFFLLLRCAAIG